MDAALIVERHRAGTRAIAGEYVTKFGNPHLGTVLRDQPRDTQPAAALARDFEHRDRVGDVAEGDGVASSGLLMRYAAPILGGANRRPQSPHFYDANRKVENRLKSDT